MGHTHSSGLEEEEITGERSSNAAWDKRGFHIGPAKVFGWETASLEAGTVELGLTVFLF